MTELDVSAHKLLDLYRTDVRSLLEEHKFTTLEGLDQAAKLLELALARDPRVDVGFLGESQVGKSTLINAVLGTKALPSGGVGPLTAQATRISYATTNRLEVTYHGRTKLSQLAFGIERYLERRGDFARAAALAAVSDAAVELPDEVIEATIAAVEPISAEGETTASTSTVGEYMLSQARLMLAGSDDPKAGPGAIVLRDGIHAVLERPARGAPDELAPLRDRISAIQSKLGQREETAQAGPEGRKEFIEHLRQHAAGWLAPLVSNLGLELDNPALEQLVLVDLPGVGVVDDPAARVAEEFVLGEADALVIVARNNGLTDAIASLLERTNVITKLLFGGRDGQPAIHIVIAITHLDDVAKDRCSDDGAEGDDAGADPDAIFRALADQMAEKVRTQLAAALRASRAFEGVADDLRARREFIIDELCRSMDVISVAAPDYLLLQRRSKIPPFLHDLDTTGVPAMLAALGRLAGHARETRTRGVAEALTNFRETLLEHVRAIGQMYEEGRGRAAGEWDRFRSDLLDASRPLREQMQASHGELLATLRDGIPQRLSLLCAEAHATANAQLRRLRRDGDKLHFKTLNAVLTRSGVYDRRDIDYPDALTRAMVDVIASRWEPTIVDGVRQTVQAIASRDLKLVEQLCDKAQEYDERITADSHVDAQKKILQQQSRSCIAWTREQLDKLRDDVAVRLKREISKPVDRACVAATKAGINAGSGAKRRILEVFEDGGAEAIAKARDQSTAVLRQHYDALVDELQKGFLSTHHDPMQAAFDALTNDELQRARRSDAQRRRRVLEQVGRLSSALGE